MTDQTFDVEKLRREMDASRARAESVALETSIKGLANPYFDVVRTLAGSSDLREPWWTRRYDEALVYARRRLAEHYAWAIPDERALEIVGETGSVVEIGAGGGYWAALLRARGVEIFAYDPKPGATQWSKHVWTEVEIGGIRPVERHPSSTLFLCWPPYTSRLAEIAVRRFVRAGGTRVAYIGEYEGGCCAEDRFFALMDTFDKLDEYYIPHYPGMHDYLTVWDTTHSGIPESKGEHHGPT